jgi:hypothetical protein
VEVVNNHKGDTATQIATKFATAIGADASFSSSNPVVTTSRATASADLMLLDSVVGGSLGAAGVGSVTVVTKGSEGPEINGIWVRTGANVWDRAADFDEDAEVTSAAFTSIEEGTQASSGWTLSTADPVIIGGGAGSDINWVQISIGATGFMTTGNPAFGPPTILT